ncbi:MAG: hypothetical protein FWD48_04680 [Oscillospiraceae bacterium]|nr:hypothetical protein [Oscillospiraceae bacterium]
MKVIKSHTYNIINPEPFEIPYPLVFELLSGNTLLAEYTISDTGTVDYSFNPNAGEKILTSIRRPLTINDIYFLFTSRIFPDKTPYTAIELERFGIEEYHPYTVIRKTRGMLPGDKYWLRFENEEINYKSALQEHRNYYENSYKKYLESLEAANAAEETAVPAVSESSEPVTEEAEQPAVSEAEVDTMSEDMINSLMASMGGEEDETPDEAPAAEEAPGGNMSPEAIAAMLAANSAPEPEPAPAAEESSGGNMSPEAIAAMLAANSAPDVGDDVLGVPQEEPEPETPAVEEAPAPAAEESPGGNMSPEAIAALLAANE